MTLSLKYLTLLQDFVASPITLITDAGDIAYALHHICEAFLRQHQPEATRHIADRWFGTVRGVPIDHRLAGIAARSNPCPPISKHVEPKLFETLIYYKMFQFIQPLPSGLPCQGSGALLRIDPVYIVVIVHAITAGQSGAVRIRRLHLSSPLYKRRCYCNLKGAKMPESQIEVPADVAAQAYKEQHSPTGI